MTMTKQKTTKIEILDKNDKAYKTSERCDV